MTRLVAIASYNLTHDAHLVKSYLESEGIDVFINDAIMGSEAYLAPTGGIKLLVPGDQVLRAKQLLKDYTHSVSTIYCPNCGSESVQQQPMKSLSLVKRIRRLVTGKVRFTCNSCSTRFVTELV